MSLPSNLTNARKHHLTAFRQIGASENTDVDFERDLPRLKYEGLKAYSPTCLPSPTVRAETFT